MLFTLPLSSVSALAVWSCFHSPSATNCGSRQHVAYQCAQCNYGMVCARSCVGDGAHLVQDLLVGRGQRYGLLVDRVGLVKLDRFGPVVKGASDVDFVGWVFPLNQASAYELSLAEGRRDQLRDQCDAIQISIAQADRAAEWKWRRLGNALTSERYSSPWWYMWSRTSTLV